MRADNPRAFLRAFALLILTAGMVTVVFDLVIDPFWRFDLVTSAGVNQQRPHFSNWARLGKAHAVCRLQPSKVIMGTSRVEVGIDPRHPGWQTVPGVTYNLALAGSGIRELYLTLQHAVHASPNLRLVVMGLDFLMFNANREAVVFGTEVHFFDEGRLLLSPSDSCLRALLHDSNALLGLRGLVYGLATIRDQMPDTERGNPDKTANWLALYDQDGFRGNNFDVLTVRTSAYGYRNLFDGSDGRGAGQEGAYYTRIWRPEPDRRYCFTRDGQPDTLEVFRDLVRFAARSGIDIRFFINPEHARMLVALREAGLWPQFEDWKRGLVAVLVETAEETGTRPFPLWDFSGFNTVTTETIPPLGDTGTVMNWFWESSHYKKEAGDLMLDRMLGYTAEARPVPDDFGILLSRSNIEAVLAATREAGRAYDRTHPAEVDIVESRVRALADGSEGSNCGYDMALLQAGSEALRRGDGAAAEAAFARAAAVHEADRRRFAELGVPYREERFSAALQRARAGEAPTRPPGDRQAFDARSRSR